MRSLRPTAGRSAAWLSLSVFISGLPWFLILVFFAVTAPADPGPEMAVRVSGLVVLAGRRRFSLLSKTRSCPVFSWAWPESSPLRRARSPGYGLCSCILGGSVSGDLLVKSRADAFMREKTFASYPG